jgi:hypothetical protein
MQYKNKKLRIKPSLKDKRRYFIANAENSKIEEAILEYLGILGFARAAYMQVFVDGQSKTIGSCLSKSLEDVRSALIFKKIRIEKVSGTISGLGR